MNDQFFVVTGGPCTGNTSLITELARRGFHTNTESGRDGVLHPVAREPRPHDRVVG